MYMCVYINIDIHRVISCGINIKITVLMTYNAERSSPKLSKKSQCFMTGINKDT